MNAKKLLSYIIFVSLLIFVISYSVAQPFGADVIQNTTETKNATPADSLDPAGGTFTTIVLNVTSQNLKWKAYIGNVTGVLTLDDEEDYSIFQWDVSEFSGSVFASRNDSITWDNVACASDINITREDTAMDHTTTADDSINTTFKIKVHKQFWVGTKNIAQSSCRSAFTWANDTAQTPSVDAPFQEVLLHDGLNMIYTTFIYDDAQGFDFNDYDFQMIVPENGVASNPNTRYYFYMELQ
jgi:hypothetical protein